MVVKEHVAVFDIHGEFFIARLLAACRRRILRFFFGELAQPGAVAVDRISVRVFVAGFAVGLPLKVEALAIRRPAHARLFITDQSRPAHAVVNRQVEFLVARCRACLCARRSLLGESRRNMACDERHTQQKHSLSMAQLCKAVHRFSFIPLS